MLGELLDGGVVAMARAVRRRQVSPTQLVEEVIARIRRLNPGLNAVVVPLIEHARREARKAEQRLAHDDPAPLLGVPFTVKEMIPVRGQPNTVGSLLRLGVVAQRSATVVDRLTAAGAILVGLTNVPEMALWSETFNLVYGRTNNPYDAARTAGKNSKKEGAAIGAKISPFGIESDIGGSIRMPAFFCGIFAHCPSIGLVPVTGKYPIQHGHGDRPVPAAMRCTRIGPMARRAADLMPLLEIMAGPDGHDPVARPMPLGNPQSISFRGRPVYVCESPRVARASRAEAVLVDAVRRAADMFEAAGAEVRRFDPRAFSPAFELWSGALRSDGGPSLAEYLGNGVAPHLGDEIRALRLGRARMTLPSLVMCAYERWIEGARGGVMPSTPAAFDAVEDDAILITPTHPRVAPPHYALMTRPFDFGYTTIFNALGWPATAAPMGLDRRGLPLGVQIAARVGQDTLTIAAAQRIEAAFGGWRPPVRRTAARSHVFDRWVGATPLGAAC